MFYNYRILPEYGLVIHYVAGVMDYDMLAAAAEKVRCDPRFEAHYHSLIDIRAAEADVNIRQLKSFMRKTRNIRGHDNSRKHALIISRPEHFVIGTYMQEIMEHLSMHISIFSTYAGASAWLELQDLPEPVFESCIRALCPRQG